MKNISRLCVFLLAGFAAAARAGDIRALLDSADGSSAFVVSDSATNTLLRVGSSGVAISGGLANTADGTLSSIGGGYGNRASSIYGRIGGGAYNVVEGYGGVVGGGGGFDALITNTVGNIVYADFGVVAGGIGNLAASNAYYAVVGGGYYNAAGGVGSVVAGGTVNTAYGDYAAVPGGIDCHATGDYSLAAGRGSVATNLGAFVWADATPAYFRSSRDNEFRVRAAGGVFFYSDAAATVGVRLAPGGNGWSAVSDRNLKENFAPVDGDGLLEKLAALPVLSWNMRTQSPDIRHLGPTAQDFKAAFGLGESDDHISYSDADGVALAAIQALTKRLESTEARLQTALTEIERLKAQPSAPPIAPATP